MKTIVLVLVLALAACNKSTPTVVQIVPFDDMPTMEFQAIAQSLKNTYGFEVELRPKLAMPQEAFIHYKTPRYRADKLIYFLKNTFQNDALKAGYTTRDISTTKKDKFGHTLQPIDKYQDWGIFGLGYRPGKACIVSTYRLGDKNSTVYLPRLTKIYTHEIGHNLGLPHCENSNCVMTDAAESIKTIDSVKGDLCMACKNELQ